MISFQRRLSLLVALCVTAGLALGLAGCGGMGTSAATMFLRKTEGTVAVADGEGADIAPAENLGLYSGYTVGTRAESYAWIDLDKVKLAKLDENGEIHIVKDGKNLSIDVNAGSLFFNITEPLAEDETMEIRASSMLVGIRGTCGWVEAPDAQRMNVYILEGRVECVAGENTAAVNAGEMAEMAADGTITVEPFSAANIPAFVAGELAADEALNAAVREASGFDVAEDPRRAYADVFAGLEQNEAAVLLAEEIDFEADGSPELLVIRTVEADEEMYEARYFFDIYRTGAEGSEQLFEREFRVLRGRSGKISLVSSGDRLFVLNYDEIDPDQHAEGISCYYYGSTAQNDGDSACWGRIDGVRYYGMRGHGVDYYRDELWENGLRGGSGEPSTIEEYESVIAQYTEVRVLAEA